MVSTLLRAGVAEFLGVFFLVLAGCGAIGSGQPELAVAFAFALAILVLVYALGHVSGAHFNPAITLAFAATGHFPWRRVPAYVAAQVSGALAAALLLTWVFRLTPGVTTPGGAHAPAFVLEFLATFLLGLVIVAVATDDRVPRAVTGLAIGLAVGVGALFAGPLSGGSMNPARTLGPALVAARYEGLWVYVLGPVLGALAAMGAYGWIRGEAQA